MQIFAMTRNWHSAGLITGISIEKREALEKGIVDGNSKQAKG